ncbi:MAG: fibronectin type III domain-containing protein, partial [Bacteroidales bacterium]|nr:fibronectin type III domain-containing protein [Bacteroidales bacterium]
MGHTTRSTISGTTDWTPANDLTLVYDGTNIPNPTTQGWFNITLDSPFPYNGTDNLVIIVTKSVNSYNSSFSYRYTSTSSNYRCMYRQSDSNPATYTSHPGTNTGTRTYNRANVRLTMGSVQCPNPKHLTVGNVTTNSADFSWTTGDHETDWEVYISDNIVPDSTTSGTAVTDTFYTFSNLNANTHYNAYVRANCIDSGAYSAWVGKGFTTSCEALSTLPYQDGFDTYGTGESAYPSCWHKINTYTSGERPYVNSTHFSGVGSLYFYTGTSGTYNIAVMPEIDQSISINSLQATFMYRGYYATDRLIVGVMDDYADATTFVPVDTVYPSAGITTWEERVVSFANYTGTGQYIAFKNAYTSQAAYGYMDDLIVDLIPACPKPTLVSLSNYTTGGCDVSWTPMGSESAWEVVAVPANTPVENGTPETAYSYPYTLTTLLDNTQYDVYVRADCGGGSYSDWSFKATFTTDPFCTSPIGVGVSQVAATSALVSWSPAQYGATGYTVGYSEAGQENWTTHSVTGTSYMISGLTAGTDYDVFVLSECNMGNADTVFTTVHTKSCFVGGDLAIGTGTSTTGYFPEYSLYEYSYSQQIFLSSEMGSASSINSISFECTTVDDPTRNLQIYLMNTSSTSGSSWLSGASAQQVYSGNVTFTLGWNTINFTTPFQYNGTDNLAVIVLDMTGTWTSTNYFSCHTASQSLCRYAYQDGTAYSITSPPSDGTATSTRNNVIFGVPCDSTITCAAPNVYVSEVTNESVTIAWAPGNAETSWELEYSEDGTNWIPQGTVTASPFTINSLTSNTTYYIRLRGNCGGGEYSDWRSVIATTACSDLTTLPFMENFDSWTGATSTSVSTNNLPSCWANLNEGTSTSYSGYPIIYNSSSYAASGSNAMRFYTYTTAGTYDDQIAILPPVDVNTNPMNTLQIAIDVRDNTTSYPFHLDVGIMTDPTDRNSFVTIQTITTSLTTYENYEIPFNQYTGTGKYIALRAQKPTSGYNYGYVDNVRVELIPACPKPTNVTATNATTNSVTLAWTEVGTATSWEIEYGPAGFTPGTAAGTIETVYTNPYTLMGLAASSIYDVYVRSDCGGGEYSNYSNVILIATECDVVSTLPLMENFDAYAGSTTTSVAVNNLPICWTNHNTGTSTSYSGYPIIYNSSSYAASGTNAMRFYIYTTSGTYSDQIAILPQIDVNTYPINTLQISFDARRMSSSYTFNVVVGVMTDPTVASTFTPVQTISVPSITYENFEVPLTSYTGTGAYIAIKAPQPTSNYNEGYIDNIMVDLTPLCDKPTNVTASNITATSADISWMPGGNETDWELVVVPHGMAVTTGTPEPVSFQPYPLSNLDYSTSYDVYVRADCGTGVDFSSWSHVHTFTTTALCSPPTNVEVSQITGTSALVTWTEAVFGATGYTVSYTEAGQQNWVTQTVVGDNYMISGLTPLTSYTMTITSECNEGVAPTITRNFTTGCLAGGDNIVGTGTTTTYNIPLNTFYNYSYVQQLYLASEINNSGDIHSIGFQYIYSTAQTKNNQYIYLAETDLTSLSTWVPADSLTLVYSGSINYNNNGPDNWVTITLDSAFTYSGTRNLVVVVRNDHGSYSTSSNYTFKAHSATGMTLQYYNDSSPFSMTSPSSASTYSSRNNIKFGMDCDNTITCIAPNVYFSEVTQNSITVNWAPGNYESSWEMETSTNGTTWTPEGTVTAAPYTLSNLTPNTLYYVRLRSDCGGGDYSNWVVVSDRTECAAISTLPYMENFDTYTGSTSTSASVNNLPNCWTFHNEGTSTSYSGYPIIYNSSSTAASGANSIRFYTYTTSGTYDDQTAILPEVDVTVLPMNTLQLSFDARALGTSYPFNLEIGVMTDPTDINTFMLVSTVTTQVTAYANYEIPLSQYAGTGAYIAIRAPQPTSNYNYGYVDNVRIEHIPTCPKPTQVHAVGVLTNSIDLAWTENGTATTWVVEYGPVGFTLGNGTLETASTNPYTISGLNASTNYDFYVRAVCDGGDSSNYSPGVTVATACDAITQLPYTEGFDTYGTGESAYPNCWGKINTYTSVRPYVNSTHYAGVGSLYFFATSPTHNIAITPMFDVTIPVSTLQATFMYRATNSTDRTIIGVMTNPTDETTFVPVDTIYPGSPVSTWVEREVNFSHYTGTGQYIAFYNGNPSASCYTYIDDLVINLIPSCPKPTHVTVTTVDQSSLSVSWQAGGSETNWNLEYGPAGFTPGSGTTISNASNPTTITGLSASTSYDVYVQADCGSGDLSYWSTVSSGHTSCGAIVNMPYTEGFDTYGTGTTVYPLCWSKINTYSSDRPYVNSTHYEGVGSLYFFTGTSGTYNIAITPEFDSSIPMNSLTATFMYRATNSPDRLIVGVIGSTTDASTFVPVDTVYPGSTVSTWVARTVSFANYTGTGHYVAFKNEYTTTSAYAYIDNLVISMDSSVTPPVTCATPTGLAVNNVTTNTATASWTAGGTETSWNVQYKAASASNWQSATANATSYTMTGLTPNTAYQMRVQAVCDANTSSDWTTAVSFTTAQEQQTCPAPTNLSASLDPNNHTTVILTWQQEANTANEWQINYRISTESTWSTVTANATTYTLTDLTPNVTYVAHVVAHCTNGLTSDESNTVTFDTD